MKHRAILSAAVMGLLAATAMPTVNWADDGKNQFDAKFLEEREKQLKKQEKHLHAQAEEMQIHAQLAAKEAHKAAEKARVSIQKFFRGPGNPRFMTEINEQAAKYRDAEGEEDKAAALSNLNEIIEKCFEDDMKVREKELASIEERLNKLRAQLDRRRAKKQEIIGLQIKVAINEAEGLGFFSEAKGDVFTFRGPQPVIAALDGASWNTGATAHVDAWSPSPPVPASPPVVAPMPVPNSPIEIVVDPVPVAIERQFFSAGAEGDAVRYLQYRLNEYLEPSPGLTVDGEFGPETEKAVRTFQEQHKLEATGVVDAATQRALDEHAEHAAAWPPKK